MRISAPAGLIASLDTNAINAMIDAIITDNPEASAAFADEVTRAQDHTGGFGDRATSVLTHAAMAATLRKGGLGEQLEARLHASLQASWVHLTGKVADDALAALPSSVLKSVDKLTACFANAADAEGMVEALSHYNAETVPTTASERLLAAAYDAASRVLTANPDGMASAAALQRFGPSTGPTVAAFVGSYAVASLFESFYHDTIAHASPDKLKAWKNGNALQRSFADSFESHNYHHGIANQHYDVHNETPEKIAQRRAQLKKRGREDIATNDEMGVTIDNAGFAKFLAGMAPVYGPAIGAAIALGASAPVMAALIGPALLVPAASKWMHPYMHMSQDEAVAKLPKVLEPIVRSSAWEKMVLRHFVHHERAKGGVNFNILPGNVGDKLRGAMDEATPEEIARAEDIGLIKKKV